MNPVYVRPVSDLHNEFSVYNLPVTEFDSQSILMLAGDIAVADASTTLTLFLDDVADRFTDVLYIPGNHEYYHGSLNRVDDKLSEICNRYGNVHYLNQRAMKIRGFNFIGATLWTDYRGADPMVMMAAQNAMNDYVHIRTGPPGFPYQRPAKPVDMLEIHRRHRAFIEDELTTAKARGDKSVVMTHHGPSFIARPPESKVNFRHSVLDYAYYNVGMDAMIDELEPILWVHGHSHFPMDNMIGKTRLLNNPRGYHRRSDGFESSDFDGGLVIEL